jgi:hypothetical protein
VRLDELAHNRHTRERKIGLCQLGVRLRSCDHCLWVVHPERGHPRSESVRSDRALVEWFRQQATAHWRPQSARRLALEPADRDHYDAIVNALHGGRAGMSRCS